MSGYAPSSRRPSMSESALSSCHQSTSNSATASGSGRVHRRSSTGPTAERWLETPKSSGKNLKKEPVETLRGLAKQKSLDAAMKLSLLGYDVSDTELDY
jgi:hypothetical protein